MSQHLDCERQGQMKLLSSLNLMLLAVLTPSWAVRFHLKKTDSASAQPKPRSLSVKRLQQKALQAQRKLEHRNQPA